MQVMQEEIFGPLLPVVPYRDLDEAIAYVNAAAERPLALYYFDNDRGRIDRVLDETLSGGVTINDTILHIAQDRAALRRRRRERQRPLPRLRRLRAPSRRRRRCSSSRALNGMSLFKPPYGALFERLTKFLIRLAASRHPAGAPGFRSECAPDAHRQCLADRTPGAAAAGIGVDLQLPRQLCVSAAGLFDAGRGDQCRHRRRQPSRHGLFAAGAG
jgi:hypothetical protein